MDTFEFEKRLVGTIITQRPRKSSSTVTLLIILFVALISQVYWNNFYGLADFLPAIHKNVYQLHEWWRVFTAIFIHADLGHYLSNMYMMGIFGYFIYGYFGAKVFPVHLTLGAGLVNALSVATYPEEVRLLGASGLVYLMGGWWLTMYFLVQRQYSYVNRAFRVVGTSLMVFFPTTFVPSTSYRTHAIGFGIGILFAIVYFIFNKKMIRSFEQYQLIPSPAEESRE